MLCTNKGYKRSVIFSLLAKSRARSNGILSVSVSRDLNAKSSAADDLPDPFQVHRSDLDDMTRLFALQYPVSPATSHPRDVQKLGAVDHVVV